MEPMAFPHSTAATEQGMTLRDYFAAKAMPAYVAWDDKDLMDYKDIAEMAYKQADAMMAVRDK